MVSDTDSDYSENSDFLLSDLSDTSSLFELQPSFIETYKDKEIFILDYDDTIKLHNLSLNKQKRYEEKLYKILNILKTQYNKKIYLVSYNLKPQFNKEYTELFEEMYIPVRTSITEHTALQEQMYCGYTLFKDYFYRYIPKHIHIKEIAKKNNVGLSKVIFFDDNLQQITEAKMNGVPCVMVDKYIGIEI